MKHPPDDWEKPHRVQRRRPRQRQLTQGKCPVCDSEVFPSDQPIEVAGQMYHPECIGEQP